MKYLLSLFIILNLGFAQDPDEVEEVVESVIEAVEDEIDAVVDGVEDLTDDDKPTDYTSGRNIKKMRYRSLKNPRKTIYPRTNLSFVKM